MPLRAIVYSSLARDDLVAADLDALLRDATAFNRVAGVTGVLMFDGRRFVQYIEGPGDGIDSVFARISNARTHSQLQVLAQGRLVSRRFPQWAMASRQIDEAACTRLCQAHWHGLDAAAPGFVLLQSTWTGNHGDLEPAAVCLGS